MEAIAEDIKEDVVMVDMEAEAGVREVLTLNPLQRLMLMLGMEATEVMVVTLVDMEAMAVMDMEEVMEVKFKF